MRTVLAIAFLVSTAALADQPTGYQIKGPTYYVYDAHKGIVHIRDPRSTKDAKTFWQGQSSGQGPGNDSGSGSSK